MYHGNHGECIQRDEDPRDEGDRGEHPNPRTPSPTHEYYNPDGIQITRKKRKISTLRYTHFIYFITIYPINVHIYIVRIRVFG